MNNCSIVPLVLQILYGFQALFSFGSIDFYYCVLKSRL